MKYKILVLVALVATVFLISAAFTTNDVKADAPVVTITFPVDGTTYFVPAFPFATNIAFTVNHADINQLNVLEVSVTDPSSVTTSLTGVVGNPFSLPGNNPGCNDTGGGILGVPGATCSYLNNPTTVSATVPWSVPGPGTYIISTRIRAHGDQDTDVIEATYNLVVAIEHPAPPAVANAHLNATVTPKKLLTAGKRGCVISAIAQKHAQLSFYGPKGGPYNIPLIQSDANALFSSCPN